MERGTVSDAGGLSLSRLASRRRSRRRRPPVLVAVGIAGIALLVLIGFIGPFFLPDPSDTSAGPAFAPPSADLPFGTDRFGRDVLSRVVGGIRWSLFVAGVSVFAAALIGSVLGLVSGYLRGRFDRLLVGLLNLFLGLPVLVLAMTMVAGLGPGLSATIVALVVGFVPAYTLIVRSATISERGRDYILAAEAGGASRTRLVLFHLFPNVLPVIIVQASIMLSYAILAESTLGFLGLGLQPPIPSWGQMLSEGRPYLLAAPWVSLFPGIAIFVSVFAFNLLGDGLRDYLDPRMGSSRLSVGSTLPGAPMAVGPSTDGPIRGEGGDAGRSGVSA
jgi:peptide/nickel transport system permease protein